MAKFSPRPYQHPIIQAITTIKRVNIFASMGVGKTVSCLSAIHQMYLDGPVLVLAPLRVAVSTWPDEVAKWDHLQDVTISPITGNAAQRRKALAVDAMIYTCNYENLPWLVEELGDNWPFAMIIADESTRLKGFRLRAGSKRASALAKVAHSKTPHFVNLTGTPAPNGLIDLWGQCWFIDKGQRLGRTFSAFTSRWFNQQRFGNFFKLTPHPHSQKEIQTALSGITLSIDARDWFDVKEPVAVPVSVKLPAPVQKIYKQMERDLFIELAGAEVEAMNAAAKTVKCLQIASGAIYLEDGESWEALHDAKIQALESIIEEAAGAPVLVAYHWRHDLDRLRKAFPQGRALDADPQTLRDWNAGKIPVLFAHPASAGHGLNMQDGGNILVFFSLWWDLEQHQQIIERIGPTRQAQAGHDRPVFIYYIVADNTVDALALERLKTKASVQDILFKAMKRGAANDECYHEIKKAS
ncbi:DEAD/DEAH box helicase [Enterobacter bugandensis]|uniref:DEAD/DEAH box helicase n=1 Tax=Enterobacter bugandensis TaxID=881260 RepID=UPI002002D30C|nr:DEAD/DEAH box helicase [Enterobacter bugandensis]MCK7435924.1 DEAD/DEAH box helicase [Enterobacter bugandensis]